MMIIHGTQTWQTHPITPDVDPIHCWHKRLNCPANALAADRVPLDTSLVRGTTSGSHEHNEFACVSGCPEELIAAMSRDLLSHLAWRHGKAVGIRPILFGQSGLN
jgi:hypothetical protein